MMRHAIAVLAALLPSLLHAGELQTVDYEELDLHVTGIADFEGLARSEFPGTRLSHPVRYPGLAFGTHMRGEIHYNSAYDDIVAGRVAGRPHTPLRIDGTDLGWSIGFSHLKLGSAEASNMLSTYSRRRFRTQSDYDLTRVYGFGTISMAFTNAQFGVGLRIAFLDTCKDPQTEALVRFYSEDGAWFAQELRVTRDRYVAVRSTGWSRTIKGVVVEVHGRCAIAIDDVIYELPRIIG